MKSHFKIENKVTLCNLKFKKVKQKKMWHPQDFKKLRKNRIEPRAGAV